MLTKPVNLETIGSLVSIAGNVILLIADLIFAVFISLYFLNTKEKRYAQIMRLRRAIFNDAVNERITKICTTANNLFGKFVEGRLLDSLIVGVLTAMLCVNYQLTLMVLCFVPFVALFTVIFRKFSRKAHRKVKDGTTAINTFLSEHLSGMKIIQIFNREERKAAEFEVKNQHLDKAKRQEIFVFGIFRPMVYMLYVSSVLFLFYIMIFEYRVHFGRMLHQIRL